MLTAVAFDQYQHLTNNNFKLNFVNNSNDKKVMKNYPSCTFFNQKPLLVFILAGCQSSYRTGGVSLLD